MYICIWIYIDIFAHLGAINGGGSAGAGDWRKLPVGEREAVDDGDSGRHLKR